MRDIITIAKNVLKLTLRKKTSILVFMLLPIMSIFISQYLNTTTQPSVKIGVCDEDKSKLSKDLTDYLIGKDNTKVVPVKKDKIDKKILNKSLDTVIVLDKGFENDIIDSKFKNLDMITVKGADVTIWQENYLNYYIGNLLDISKSSSQDKETFFKVYDDFKTKENNITKEKIKDETNSIGVSKQSISLLLVFMLSGATVSSQTIAKDKSNKIFNRLLSSPIKISSYILGNFIANFLLNTIQVVTILIFAKLLNLNYHMPMGYVFILLSSFSLVSVGLGMFLASVSNSSAQVGYLSNAIIVPTCMLSGCFWPIEFMPKVMQNIALLLPQTWVIKSIDTLQSGNSILSVSSNILIVICFAILLLGLSIFNIKRGEKTKNYV